MKKSLLALVALSFLGCSSSSKLKEEWERRTDKHGLTRAERAERDKNAPPEPTPKDPVRITDDQRFKEYIEQTGVPAKDAYDRARKWAASAYKGDSKDAIQQDVASEHKFVARGFLEQCSAFGSFRPYEVSFLLDFQAKDGRARVMFDKIKIGSVGQLSGRSRGELFSGLFNVDKPATVDELAQVSTNCLEPLKASLIKEIQAQKGTTNW